MPLKTSSPEQSHRRPLQGARKQQANRVHRGRGNDQHSRETAQTIIKASHRDLCAQVPQSLHRAASACIGDGKRLSFSGKQVVVDFVSASSRRFKPSACTHFTNLSTRNHAFFNLHPLPETPLPETSQSQALHPQVKVTSAVAKAWLGDDTPVAAIATRTCAKHVDLSLPSPQPASRQPPESSPEV